MTLLELDKFEQFGRATERATGLGRQAIHKGQELRPRLGGEDTTPSVQTECAIDRGRADPVLEHRVHSMAGQLGAGQLSLAAEIGGWDPVGGKAAIVVQDGQSIGVDLVGLADQDNCHLGS